MCDDPIMAESIYWYDYETTGIDPARDRVLQFAGVRTDMDLNVISEPLDLFCKPGDDVLPSPDAILVTGIKMSEVLLLFLIVLEKKLLLLSLQMAIKLRQLKLRGLST